MLYLICAWINGWVNKRETGELRRLRAHYDVIVMKYNPGINIREPRLWWVNIGSCEGLVPSANKPVPEPMWNSLLMCINSRCCDMPHRHPSIPNLLCFCNTLKPRQHGRHFTDDIFKCIFSSENVWISMKNSLYFVPNGPINSIPTLVQIMAGRHPSD